MSVPTRSLGRNGPQVTAIGFGAMSLGGAYGPQNQTVDEKLAVLDRAWEIGERFWDTADIYRDSEDRIGDWFKKTGRRQDIFLATKFGVIYDPDTRAVAFRSDPEYLRAACDRSLKRLGADTIDLYYCHRVDGKTPIEKTIEAMVELKKEGKIRYLGLSEVSAATIRRAHAVHPISAVQVEYSPFCVDIESAQVGVLSACRELGIAVVAYSPVGRGFLTGQVRSVADLPADDFRRHAPKYADEANFARVLALVDRFAAVAKNHACFPAQACLAFMLAQGDDIIPIPGTKTIRYLEENTAAASIVLSDDEVADLRRAVDETEFTGARYPEYMVSSLFGDTPALEQ